MLFRSGKFYTLGIDKLPGGRGHGEPLRLMIDMAAEDEVVTLQVYTPGNAPCKLLLASTGGRGFLIAEDAVIAQTRNGKQVLNLAEKEKALLCLPVAGDSVAVVGQNRKLLIFKADEIHEYYLKLEETLQDVIEEESNELKQQLLQVEDQKAKEYELKDEEDQINKLCYHQEAQKYVCQDCGTEYKSKYSLIKHFKNKKM